MFAHWRSIAERVGCFQRHLFVCQHDNFRTIKRKMKLGEVRCTKISPEFEFGDQRSKVKVTRDKKRKSAAFLGERSYGHELCRPPVLRRWENQLMLSSFIKKYQCFDSMLIPILVLYSTNLMLHVCVL